MRYPCQITYILGGIIFVNSFLNRNVKWIFPLPTVIFIVVMLILPILFTFGVSLTNWQLSGGGVIKFIGFQNYIDLFTNGRFYNSILLTFYFSLLCVGVESVLGVATAVFLNREFIGKNVMKTIILLPMVCTPVAIGMAWTLFYEPTVGLANYILVKLGFLPCAWLASQKIVIPAIALIDIWQWTPMITLIVMSGLAGMPSEPFESARVDGANKWQIFWNVTLPLISPTILTAMTLRAIDAFKTFDIIYTTTAGGPLYSSETLNVFGYKEAFNYFHFGSSSAILMALFVIVLGVGLIFMKVKDKRSAALR